MEFPKNTRERDLKMFIPETLKVRIRKNSDSVPLGYVTYLDEKGKLRKEESWIKWGTDFLGDFNNLPKNGFQLETVVKRSRDWFGTGRTMFRIKSPDGFVFEITSNNFKEICEESTIEKGLIKDSCVFAWDGPNLALIPTNAEEYVEHRKHTDMIVGGKVKIKELVVGKLYKNKSNQDIGYYLGKYKILHRECKYIGRNSYMERYGHYNIAYSVRQVHIFCMPSQPYCTFFVTPDVYNSENVLKIPFEKTEQDVSKLKFGYGYDNILFPKQFEGEFSQEDFKKFVMDHEKMISGKYYREDNKNVIDILWKTF